MVNRRNTKLEITIHHFYPDLLNTYGDIGNILSIKDRCSKRDISVNINNVKLGDTPELKKGDIVFIGGGQDFEQSLIVNDLLSNRESLYNFIENDGSALCICGGYQLMGKSYTTVEGKTLEGLNILNIYTESSETRKIGNIIILNEELNETYVGFENHSGITFINDHSPLGKCIVGNGNNGEDKSEGVIYKNLIGTYMHGPLLPKNPEITDRLILNSLKQKYEIEELEEINSEYEIRCREILIKRFSN